MDIILKNQMIVNSRQNGKVSKFPYCKNSSSAEKRSLGQDSTHVRKILSKRVIVFTEEYAIIVVG